MAEPAFSDSTENDSIEPRYDPAKVTSANFDTVRRGFNEVQVRKFLGDLAVGLRSAYRTEDELRERIEELVNRLAEADGVDEVTLIERLGEQAASLLKSARASAKARTDEADEHAERVVSEGDEQADSVRIASEEQAASLIGGATDQATALLAEASEVSASMRAEAASFLELRTNEAEVEAEKLVEEAEN
ncbi:MAG: DivIVA domain-containing protein, partial [Acidimicrobiales bacterium]